MATHSERQLLSALIRLGAAETRAVFRRRLCKFPPILAEIDVPNDGLNAVGTS